VKYVQQSSEPAVHFTGLPTGGLENADFRMAAQKSIDAVVHVTSTKFMEQNQYGNIFEYFFNEPSGKQVIPQEGYGSGVIISPDGYIVTNNHVVKDADEIKVKLNNGQLMDAELIGTDPNTDVALIKVDKKNLAYLTFGDSDEALVGDWVLAVGNPWNLYSTVTAGIVSAKARNIHLIGSKYRRDRYGRLERSPDPNAVESFIQTDAAVNPGNSGGALVNLKGEMIGMNTAIASQTGAFAGYSFAIPSIIVKKVVDDLIEYGKVNRAALGVRIRDVDAELADSEKLDITNGVYVADLTADGGALKAGMKVGDVITEINGKPVASSSELQEQVMKYSPGDEVELKVDRKGKTKYFKFNLKDHEANATTVSSSQFWAWLGADLKKLEKDDLKRMDIDHGVRVKKIQDGVLKKSGMPEGFVITNILKEEVDNVQDVKRIIEGVDKGGILIEGIKPNGDYDYYVIRK
ncbi:MAG: Do family serine endopeptidase, partial [Bacteroidales bacterium]|nr:Do family serine endopeptidase [Bacteroidales bacterium]